MTPRTATTTIPFRALLASELRRCLARRAVRVLVLLALAGIAVAGVVALVGTQAHEVPPPGHGGEYGDGHIANLRDLWLGDGRGVIVGPVALLGIGALLGGSLVVGGEWKAGTVLTSATWEVRRHRLLGARLVACGVLAPAIGAVLLVLFVAATLPVALVTGSTSGLDGAWWLGLGGVVARGLGMVAVAAVLGGVIASIARGTTAAFVLLFALNAVVEPAIRGWRPSLGRWLVGENVVVWVGGGAVEEIDRGPAVAGLLLGLYVAAAAAAAIAVFRRRDLGPAT